LIILAQHHDGERTATPVAASRFIAILVAGLALGAGGCTQTTTQAISEPVVTAPIVLNSAPGSTVAPTALAPAATTAAPPGTVAATTSAPAPAAPAPVAVAPAPVAPQPVAAAAPEPLPTAAPAAADDGEFPNINKPPTQPNGVLLPEAERARIIAELEALRAKQDAAAGDGSAGGNAADLAAEADTHGQAAIKQIEACSEEGALQNNPDCAPVD
jgi:hypothetical protein